MIARLPDEWQFRCDPEDKGESEGYWSPDASSEGWRTVKTYSATLEEQVIGDEAAVMWYSVRLDIPEKPEGKLFLWLAEVDGLAKVWVNGRLAGEGMKARVPFDLDVSDLLKAGENRIAVRVDQTHPTELALGGIPGPAFIYSSPTGIPQAVEPQTQQEQVQRPRRELRR